MKYALLLVLLAVGCAHQCPAPAPAPKFGASLLFPQGGGSSSSGLTDTQLRASAITVSIRNPAAASATLSNVAGSASVVTLLASNTSRKGAAFFNDSTAVLYIKFGAAASATSFTVRVAGGGYYEMPSYPLYDGIITGIWASATGAVRITELT